MKQRLATTLLLLAGIAGCGEPGTFASLGTAGTGGIYYPLGGAIARMLSEAVPGLQVTAEVTGGSVENLNRVLAGEMDLGMAIGTTLAEAMAGQDSDRYGAIRIVAPLYPNAAHILIAPGMELTSLADAASHRISIGAPGSGTEQMARDILNAHGLGDDDYSARHLSFAESATALRDSAIDAAILSVGYPAAAVLEATTTGGVGLLAIPGTAMGTLTAAHSHYRPGAIPAGTYAGMDDDVATAVVMNWVFARDDVDDAIVTALLDALRDRVDELATVNEVARQIDLSALESAPMPLHAAARAWLRASPPATPGT